MEVDDQAQPKVEKPEVGKYLEFVDGGHLILGLEIEDHLSIDD